MGTIASLNVVLAAQTAPFQKGLQSAQGALSGFGRGVGGIGSVIGTGLKLALGPIGLVVGAVTSIGKSFEVAGDQARAVKKLNAVLAATGGAAGLSSQELQTFAADLQGVTNYGDQTTISAMAVLATFREIKGDVFKDVVVAAQDMSTVLGTDLQQSVLQLGKAFNDPTKGITALRRAGVSFTAAQITQIKTLQQSGDLLGAQKVVLAELQGEFGGAAKALASPFAQLKNKLVNMGEQIGAVFLSVRNLAITLLTPIVDAWTYAFTAIATVVKPVLGALNGVLSAGVSAIISVVIPLWQGFATFLGEAITTVLDYLAPVIVSWGSTASAGFTMLMEIGVAAWDALSMSIGVAVDFIGSCLNAVGINLTNAGSLGSWLSEMMQAAFLVMEFGYTHWKDVASLALLSVGYGIVSFANQSIYFLTVALPGYLSWFGEHWKEVFTDILNLTAAVATNIFANLSSLWEGIVGLFSGEGFTFTWTPLTEGFTSAIKELPKIAERELGPLEKELGDQVSALAGKVNEDFGAFANKRAAEITTETEGFRAKVDQGLAGFLPADQQAAPNINAPTAPALSGGAGAESKVGALVRGSAEAFKAANSNGLADLTNVANKQLAQAERQTAALEDMAGEDDGGVDI